MKVNKLLITSILILSAAIIFGSVWIGYSINEAQEVKGQVNTLITHDKALLTEQEIAQYLGITQDKLNILLVKEEIERQGRGSYDTYRYMSYIKIDEVKYFLKNGVDQWVQYHISRGSEFNAIN